MISGTLRIGDFIKGLHSELVYEVLSRSGNSYTAKNVNGGSEISAWASDYWIRVEKPETRVKAKVGDRVRWTCNEEWTEGRVYEIRNGCIWYIRDKVGNTGLKVGQVACLYLVDSLYYDKYTKVIAD